ncbi:MAG: CBS domain-containing protein, partial [Chloroflexi bacterium]|nr:CBS domain-containing protein [Chloroflexota bacterium]
MNSVSKCMKRKVISISQDAPVREAVTLVVENKVGTLPVLDEA